MEASAPPTRRPSSALSYGVGDTGDIAPGAGRHWWYFFVTGSVWAIFSLTVFRFDLDSAGAIGAVVGAVCIVAGIAQFMALGVSSAGWRIVRVILGLLFVVVGVVALAYPAPDLCGDCRLADALPTKAWSIVVAMQPLVTTV